MDFTPILQNISADSGCHLSSSDVSSSYVETPVNTLCRKRKFSHSFIRSQPLETPEESPAVFTSAAILSSTLNESLSKSLEKCNLEEEERVKKYKLDDSPGYQPKTRSAPTTPTKHLEPELSREKSRSENLSYYTPSKSTVKLGSPKWELLYPNIKPVSPPLKLKTPEKLRDFIKKVNSPAKKRLFKLETDVYRKVDRDPVSVFLVKNDFRHIVSKIFEYLSDRDLCTVSRVSRSWKKALMSDHKAFPRFYSFAQEFNSNKENISMIECDKPDSPPSPIRDSFHKCTKIAAQLLPSQSLQKCIRCMEPAVIQRSISQCQNPNCEYIYCLNCMSFSTTGPENFVDRCNTSELVLERKEVVHTGLYDISNRTPLKYDSSGYISDGDMSPIIRRSFVGKHHSVFSNISNKLEGPVVRRVARRSSLVSVVSPSTPRIAEVMEPSSPPKVRLVAGSKQSKKNLKRLNF